jgi:hypothetical protein
LTRSFDFLSLLSTEEKTTTKDRITMDLVNGVCASCNKQHLGVQAKHCSRRYIEFSFFCFLNHLRRQLCVVISVDIADDVL